uniref:Protein-glutamate O-methyltransferase n=1 Tax=uncultured bacterium contig00019 TaxID=1181510 RepID=A0A806K047_9BACT|nr:protein-glutamate O-methyltransferase [uncultured bacterium contig00019]
MSGLEKKYDIIFFRNSIIYFSYRNRLFIFNSLAQSLHPDGLLFLGVSETSSLDHPLLANRYLSNAFYFQKTGIADSAPHPGLKQNETNSGGIKHKNQTEKQKLQDSSKAAKQAAFPVNCSEIAALLKNDEGKTNAENVIQKFNSKDAVSIPGSGLCAAVIYCLHTHEMDCADKILTFLEERSSCACIKFLRGEYYLLRGNNEEAGKHYHEAAIREKHFWPAFYRIASLASEGNMTRYEYKIKKAIESIELFQNREREERLYYECFMDGFSPDYFLRILVKKLV